MEITFKMVKKSTLLALIKEREESVERHKNQLIDANYNELKEYHLGKILEHSKWLENYKCELNKLTNEV